MNVGEEVFGKGSDFNRPVLILKKLSVNSCVVLPLTTKKHKGSWFYSLSLGDETRWVMMNHIRSISGNRLSRRLFIVPEEEFGELKKSVAELLGLSHHHQDIPGSVGYPKNLTQSVYQADLEMQMRYDLECRRIGVMATILTTPEFEEAYKRLNPEQKEAVDTINGPIFVVAGPGTGKTQVLALRIANILKLTDTAPESILALTFTETGAREMRERISRLIGSTTAWKIRIHTFHGFAQSLVSRFPDQFPRIVGADIASDAERAEILEAAIQDPSAKLKLLRPFGDQLWYHYEIGRAISTMKRENVTVHALEERVLEAEKEFDAIPGKIHEKGKYEGKMKGEFETMQKKIAKTRELLSVYELYEKGLQERRRYDFEDVILEGVRALSGVGEQGDVTSESDATAFKREVQEGLLYVLADEHQDANKSQNALLEHLTDYDDHPNLFIVGDEKQAIYRFQGADLDNVHYFRERFTGTKVIVLTQNYRSTQTILDSALSLIKASPDERLSQLPLQSNKTAKGSGGKSGDGKVAMSRPITIAHAPDPESEADYLAEEIKKLLAAGTPAAEIAVLARRNRDIAWLGDGLAKRGVQAAASGEERNALANPFVMALRRLLIAINEQRDEHLAGILSLPGFNISGADAWRIMNEARLSHATALHILSKDDALDRAMLSNPKSARALYELLLELGNKASYERPVVVADEAFRKSGLREAMLASPHREQHFGAMRAFFGLLTDLSSREHDALLPRALALTTLYEERGIPLKGQEDETMSVGSVKIMTVHKSKGREFSYVFVPRLTESAWSTRNRPEHFYLPDILSGATELEDERRLLYVAMTRAKEHLTISYSLTRDDGKETAPSSLIEGIDVSVESGLVEIVDIPEREETDPLEFLPSTGLREVTLIPSDDDKQVLRDAFLAQGLSPTALNNYLQCPTKYFYANLLRFPEPENKYMLFGTAIHLALKSYADRRERGDDVPGDYLVTEFSRALSKTSLSLRDIDELLEKGKRALLAWWRENQVSWPSKTESEIPVDAPFTLPDGTTFTIRGKLDRLDPLGDHVRVIDYKTGKPKSRKELTEGDANYYRQLQFYKLLLACTDKPREMTEGIIEFVEPDDKDQLRREVFDLGESDITDLEGVITKAAQEILTFEFLSRRCDDEACEWCGLRYGLTA